MKLFTFLFIFTFFKATVGFAGDYVENFGSKGWLSDSFDIQDRIENFLGNGQFCNKANKSEMDEVVAKMKRVTVTNPESLEYAKNFDVMVEEFTFLETAARVNDFTVCQAQTFKSIFENSDELDQLLTNSYYEFERLESILRVMETRINNAEEDYDRHNIVTDPKFDNMSGNGEFIRNIKNQKRKVWKDLESLRSVLISRIPYGNRPEMREAIISLIQNHNQVSSQQFRINYLNTLGLLSSQARQSKSFFEGIQVSGNNKLHRVDENLKKSLVQSGQMKNSLALMSMSTEIETDIMCRMDARYKNGPKNRQIAEIPFYFAGAYGLGRLAAFASVKAFGGLSSAIGMSARAALIGLDTYEIATLVDEAAEACFRDEFVAHVQESCSAQSELHITYQEASLAQCLTTSVLAAAPVAITGGLRVRSAGGVSGVKESVNEIIVNFNTRINFFISKGNARLIRSTLTERKLLGDANITLEDFNGLTPKQKVYLLEDGADVALSVEQAEKLLQRSSRGQSAKSIFDQDLRFDRATVRAILRLNNKDKTEIDTIISKLESRGIVKGDLSRTRVTAQTFLREHPNVNAKILANETRIKGLSPEKSQVKIDSIMNEVPENMKAGFRTALTQLGDTNHIAKYIRELQEETAFKMIKTGQTPLAEAAKRGEFDLQTMVNILKGRVTGQGRKILTIKDKLTSQEFNTYIGKGYIIDVAFSGTTHGKYSHLLQQDMVYNSILKKSNISYDELKGFMGTPAGQRAWDDMFDGFDENALSPEWIQSNIIEKSFN